MRAALAFLLATMSFVALILVARLGSGLETPKYLLIVSGLILSVGVSGVAFVWFRNLHGRALDEAIRALNEDGSG